MARPIERGVAYTFWSFDDVIEVFIRIPSDEGIIDVFRREAGSRDVVTPMQGIRGGREDQLHLGEFWESSICGIKKNNNQMLTLYWGYEFRAYFI